MRTIHDQRAREHFEALTHAEQIAAVARMADDGHGDYSIASATGWAVEEIRRVLGERSERGSAGRPIGTAAEMDL